VLTRGDGHGGTMASDQRKSKPVSPSLTP
jgi:hypothetical protein